MEWSVTGLEVLATTVGIVDQSGGLCGHCQADHLRHFSTVGGVADHRHILGVAGAAAVTLATVVVCTANRNTFGNRAGINQDRGSMDTSGEGTIHGIGRKPDHYIVQPLHGGNDGLEFREFSHAGRQPMLNVRSASHDHVNFLSQPKAVHVAGIKPAEILGFGEGLDHIRHPAIPLPILFIECTGSLDRGECIHSRGGVATGAGSHQFTIGTNRTGAGLQGFQGPGLDAVKLRGFGEFYHLVSLLIYYGMDYDRTGGFGNHPVDS